MYKTINKNKLLTVWINIPTEIKGFNLIQQTLSGQSTEFEYIAKYTISDWKWLNHKMV